MTWSEVKRNKMTMRWNEMHRPAKRKKMKIKWTWNEMKWKWKARKWSETKIQWNAMEMNIKWQDNGNKHEHDITQWILNDWVNWWLHVSMAQRLSQHQSATSSLNYPLPKSRVKTSLFLERRCTVLHNKYTNKSALHGVKCTK